MQKGSAISARDRELLFVEGWTITSEKPMELRDRMGSVATKIAALEILISVTKKNSSSVRDAIRFAVKAVNLQRTESNSKRIDKTIKTLKNLIS